MRSRQAWADRRASRHLSRDQGDCFRFASRRDPRRPEEQRGRLRQQPARFHRRAFL